MNVFDILIIIIVACAIFFAVRRIRAARKNGGCGCGCSGCSKVGSKAANVTCGARKSDKV